MKTNFMKVSTWAMALCASMAVFTACNDDEMLSMHMLQEEEVITR